MIDARARRRRRLPLVIAFRVFAAAALVLAFRQREFFIARAAGLLDDARKIVKADEPPAVDAGSIQANTPGAASAPSGPRARIAGRPKEPAEPPEGTRRFYGVVYDLKSLRPVPHAVVKIDMSATGPAMDYTDEDGHYQLDVVPYDSTLGPSIAVSAPGYRAGQIEDPDPTYLQRTLEERLVLISELTPMDLEAVPLRYASGAKVIPLDLVLVPEGAPPR